MPFPNATVHVELERPGIREAPADEPARLPETSPEPWCLEGPTRLPRCLRRRTSTVPNAGAATSPIPTTHRAILNIARRFWRRVPCLSRELQLASRTHWADPLPAHQHRGVELAAIVVEVIVVDGQIQTSAVVGGDGLPIADEYRCLVTDAGNQSTGRLIGQRSGRREPARLRARGIGGVGVVVAQRDASVRLDGFPFAAPHADSGIDPAA